MSEAYIRLVDDTSNTGKKVRTIELSVSGNTIEQQVVTLADSSGNLLDGAVVGNVAHDGADSGAPVKIGAKYNATLPSVSTTGDRSDLQCDINGLLLTRISHQNLVFDVTPTMDTSAYTAGDVWFDTITCGSVARIAAGTVTLDTVTILDEDDQTAAGVTLVFLDANTSLGTINGAPNISDANARNILGTVSVASGDWVDLGGAKVACLKNIGLTMTAASASQAIYMAGICAGTPTQTASGVKIKLGFRDR